MIKPKLTILVGPPCSGKTTYSKELQKDDNAAGIFRISQDEQGKGQYFHNFITGVQDKLDIVVDRMNFDKKQREKFLKPAKEAGYETEIIVLHEPKKVCIERGLKRLTSEHHETIKDEKDLHKAVNFFFSHYERPTDDEADTVTFKYPELTMKLDAIICDIDGTMANIDHRLHHVRGEGKPNWKAFFENMDKDTPNNWCKSIITELRKNHIIIMCSGRPDNHREVTTNWLKDHNIIYDELLMRPRDDHRDDSLIKEVILDFEILTRYDVAFTIDDRARVVNMWRKRGITCLACADGNF